MEAIFNPLVTILDLEREYKNSKIPFNIDDIDKELYNTAFPFEAPLVHKYAIFFLDPKQVALVLLLETLLRYHLWKCPSGF